MVCSEGINLKAGDRQADDEVEMTGANRFRGYLLAAVGSGGALLSLWAPWYQFHIPQAVLDRAQALAGQFGVLGQFIKGYAQAAQALGPIHLTAWDVFKQIDVVLAVAASIGAIFAVLALSGRGRGVGQLIAVAGAIVALVAGYRVVSLPGPSEILNVMYGAYVAIACGVLMVVGGLLAMNAEQREDEWTPTSDGPASWATAPMAEPVLIDSHSVPPPSH